MLAHILPRDQVHPAGRIRTALPVFLLCALGSLALLSWGSHPMEAGTGHTVGLAELARLTSADWNRVFEEAQGEISFVDASGQSVSATSIRGSEASGAQTSWTLATDRADGATARVVAASSASGILRTEIAASFPVREIRISIPMSLDEHFYGLGERSSSLDLAGRQLENWTADQAFEQDHGRTSYSPTPFLLSSRGYGVLLDSNARATFDLRASGLGTYSIQAETDRLRLYLIYGPEPQAILEKHGQIVGLPPLPPQWALGVWKNLIGGQARVERDVQRLQDNAVPVDAIWIYDAVDERASFGWPWQVHTPIPPGKYPDLAAMVHRLQERGLKVLGYLNPFIYPGTASFREAEHQGFLVQTRGGQSYLEPWTFTSRSYMDFTNPPASAWWKKRVVFALTTLGFDGAMLDFGEGAPSDASYADGESGAVMHNRYPTLYVQAAYAAAQAAKPGDTVFFSRSGYLGSQAYTTGRFTGDQTRSWDSQKGLPSVLPAMLNGSISGWPYWGPDIAGFFDAGLPNADESLDARAQRIKSEKELWIRWVELGALSPTMRDMLGWQRDPVGLWTDGETLSVFRLYARLHTALMPYLYRYAGVAHERGLPILRPLFLNYPSDPAAYTLDDEYLTGDDLLVAPVLHHGQSERQVYLPDDQWWDFWTGQSYRGPGWVTVAAPLHRIPIFVRQGVNLELPAAGELAASMTSDGTAE